MSRENRPLVRRNLRSAQGEAVAASSVILSLLNGLIAYIACFMLNSALNLPVSYNVVPFIFFVSLEALYAKQIEKRILKNYGRSMGFRVAELLILALLLRLLLLFAGGETSSLASFTAQLNTPGAAFFSGEYTTALVLLFLLWVFCLLNLNDMQAIFNLEEHISWEQIGKEQTDLIKTRQAFIQRFLFLGLALLTGMFLSVSTWSEGETISVKYNGTPPILVGVMLLYFFFVLLLMSQTQLARLRTRWWLNESVIHPLLSKRWLRVSLVFFAVLSLAVLLLPTGFGEDLLVFLQILLLWLAALGQALLALLLLALALLFPWLNLSTDAASVDEAAPSPTPVPEAITERLPPAWLDQAGNILFWVVLGLVVGFAIFQYLRQDRSLIQDIRTLFHKIAEWFIQLWRSLASGWQDLQIEIQSRTRRRVRGTQNLDDLLPMKGQQARQTMDQPRLHIFVLYQSLLQWGTDHGWTRKPHQTPLEYEANLENKLTESEALQPIRDLTDRFDEARYSQRSITAAEAEQLAKEWENAQKKLL